jgi:hypothetical protein
MDQHEIEPGDPHHAAIQELVQLLDEATGDFRHRWPDPVEARAMLAAAGSLFAGSQIGVLLALGELKASQRTAAMASAMRNFGEGVHAGEQSVAKGKGKLQ